MPKWLEPSRDQRSVVFNGLSRGLRMDGRGLDEMRDLSLEFGSDYGAVDVQLGKTRYGYNGRSVTANNRLRVRANVSCEVVRPYSDRPFDGIFNIATELSPMAHEMFEQGRYVSIWSNPH